MADAQATTGTRKVQKSPEAFRTISEVSAALDVPQHVLRFWETKFKIVKPLKRGGGRRYYRPSDVDLIRGIRELLYKHGFTIKGAQRLLKDQGNKPINVDVMVSGAQADSNPALAHAAENGAGSGLSEENRQQISSVLMDLQALRKILG